MAIRGIVELNSRYALLIAILVGLAIGFVVALPPGPVGITAIKYGLFREPKDGTQLVLGNGIMDFVYCLVALFATGAMTDALSKFSYDYPYIVAAFQFTVVMAFIALGIFNLRNKQPRELNFNDEQFDYQSGAVDFLRGRGPLFLGIAIALSNLANPTFSGTLAWIGFQAHDFGVAGSPLNKLLFAAAFGAGNFLWLFILVRLVARYKHRLSDVMLLRIRQFAGLTFIGVGTVLGANLIGVGKLTQALRFVFAI